MLIGKAISPFALKKALSGGGGTDADAQAFITATGITGTNATATNQLVLDLKAANIWTKMKAVYPIVGGTATAHKFNLKNPLDTDAAFRLVFNGGWTHSANGALPNGTNAYADTFLSPSTVPLTNNSTHLSVYSRTNTLGNYTDIGCVTGTSGNGYFDIVLKWSDNNLYTEQYNFNTNRIAVANTNSQGFYISNRTSSTVFKLFKNGTQFGTTNTSASTPSVTTISSKIYLSAINNNAATQNYSNRELAFASIGDGLTDLESQLFYQITEKYQVALSRNINTTQSFYYNSAYNNETNAFLFSTQITDNTIQTATNTLVSDLKTANLWTKMKAIYPMVGGTATTCKFNLANSMDIDSAFRLTFAGGWTYSVNGALPNGTNAYANTFFVPNGNLTLYNSHLSYYSRTSTMPTTDKVLMGGANNTSISNTKQQFYLSLNANTFYAVNNSTASVSDYASIGSQTSMSGLLMNNRTSSTSTTLKIWKNGNSLASATTTPGGENLLTNSLYLAARRNMTTSAPYAEFFYNGECAFASIGDGLTDAEALALYNAVQTFNTTLNRQVP